MNTKVISLRVPEELKRWIDDEAAKNCRSLNNEIVFRLMKQKEEENTGKLSKQ